MSWAASFALAAPDDRQLAPSCKYCPMDRQKFAHSRMVLGYEDGSTVSTCSLQCAAVDLALTIEKRPKMIRVGDYNTKKLIAAEKAFWKVGGSKPGVMTRKAKWAFKAKTDADAFIKENGGAGAIFDEVVKLATEDMHQDTKMIGDKRKMMKKPDQTAPVMPHEMPMHK